MRLDFFWLTFWSVFARPHCVWRPITFQAASVFVSSPHHLMVCFTSAWKLCWWITSPRVPCTLLSPVLCWCFGRMAFTHQILFMRILEGIGQYWEIHDYMNCIYTGLCSKCCLKKHFESHTHFVGGIHKLYNFSASNTGEVMCSCIQDAIDAKMNRLQMLDCWNRPNRRIDSGVLTLMM